MDHREIAGRFNARLGRVMHTRVVGGAVEPLYLPAIGSRPAQIRYTRDHAQSVLHELAHWCLAGPERRLRQDYGYWYQAPPRSACQQARFFRAEVPVQALELLLARACGVPFHFSIDDPDAIRTSAHECFERDVRGACQVLLHRGPDGDVARLLNALQPAWRARLGAAS
jgi:elongation factor P hydroxylase